jgi:hypothetical protein
MPMQTTDEPVEYVPLICKQACMPASVMINPTTSGLVTAIYSNLVGPTSARAFSRHFFLTFFDQIQPTVTLAKTHSTQCVNVGFVGRLLSLIL